MKDNTKPLLTIGIIFKNEIRCLERCLKSLRSLRDTIPCELIMADTGSADGSREVAAQYADILFDFPWVEDFSAARNAVMERASGKWYMTVDADEYLGSDVSELADFLKSPGKASELAGGVVQRNYDTMEMDGKYSDFLAVRLICMSTGLRYRGAIHEAWFLDEKGIHDVRALSHTILHHDGYVDMDGERGREKRERNLSLLRGTLKLDPENLKTLLQYIESGRRESDYLETIRHATETVKAKGSGWQLFGPPIFRHAVKAALEEELKEFWEWTAYAEKWFPESYYTRIDIEYIAFTQLLKEGNHPAAIQRGEKCLHAIKEFRKNEKALAATLFSTILMASPYWEQGMEIYLADLYIKNGRPERARELLQDMDGTFLDMQQTGNLLCVLGDLHRLSRLDTVSLIQKLYEDMKKPVPSEETARKREEMFFETATLAFLMQNRKEELLEPNFCRPSYMLFLPLINNCDIGRGAAVLALQNPDEIRLVLSQVEDWNKFPVEALAHALELGISFPLSEKSLMAEEVERLVARLSESMEDYVSWIMDMIKKETDNEKRQDSLQTRSWEQRLVLTAVRIFGWENDKTGMGVELARLFASLEKAYLSGFYAPELLCPENLMLLPAFHRFGWYCAKAFEALESGDAPAYVRELKAGLETCPEAKAIAEYLIKNTPQLNAVQKGVSKELLNLAEQVRKLLSAYPPNHPAVAAIKASEAYQKVAELIEQ